tara:strand:- start:135 stop:1076 length:942 start_codon:yes stop_codon:yes gene_type:complete
MHNYFFSHARTAFKYILKKVIKKNDEVLIPDYICDSLIHPLLQLNVNFKYYKIDINLKADWDDLSNLVNKKTRMILFVNYFGIPNEIYRYQDFAKKHKILLVEDNSHGFNGQFENQILGTFGDFGIASPRKQLKIYSGGILYSKLNFVINLPKYKTNQKNIYVVKAKKYISKFPYLKKTIKKTFLSRPKYESQHAFREKYVEDYLIDDISLKIIQKNNQKDDIIKYHYNNFKKFEKFSFDNKLNPVFTEYPDKINPWCYPVYVRDQAEQIKWYNWAWKNNIDLFSWPTLPDSLLNKNSNSYKLWTKIICFSTK